MGLKITEGIQPKRLRQWSRKNLDGRLLPRMKTIVASLEAGVELGVDRFNLFTDPDTDGEAVIRVIYQIHHFWI